MVSLHSFFLLLEAMFVIYVTSNCRSANHAPEDVLEAIDTSLKDLQLDYLDLYLVIPMLDSLSSQHFFLLFMC